MKKAIFFAFLAVSAATAQTFTAGVTGSIIGGMGYRNPVLGGFARVHYAPGRLALWEMVGLSNDKKVFNDDGNFFLSITEVGFRATGRLTPEAVMYVGRQSNSNYKKTTTGVGGGLRYALAPNISFYGQFLAADRSFNDARRIITGVEGTFGRRWYAGFDNQIVMFEQPGRGRLVGMELTSRLGIQLGRKHE